MSSPSSPSRREFFKRAGTVTAAVAVVVTPLSLFAQKPSVWKDKDGKMVVEGNNITLSHAYVEGGLELRAMGAIRVADCYITGGGEGPRLSFAKP